MNLIQFLFILIFEFILLLGFSVLIAPFIGKTAIESICMMLLAIAFSAITVGIVSGIAFFSMYIYDKLEDRT